MLFVCLPVCSFRVHKVWYFYQDVSIFVLAVSLALLHIWKMLSMVSCVPALVRTRWMYAADSNLHFFCRDLGITLVVGCNLLLVWAPPVAREAARMCVYVSVRLVRAFVPAFWCLVIWQGVLLGGHALVIKPGLSPHLKPSIMLLDPRRWS